MKKIGVFTSTRAEFGLLKNLAQEFSKDKGCDLYLLVSGTHLSEKHGYTLSQIDQSVFKNIIQIPVEVDLNESEIFSQTVSRSAKVLSRLKLETCVVLGDRFEAFAFAVSAYMNDVNLVHFHGGELTLGAKDDTYRHCITKLSKLHFTAHKEYANRVIQLGEDPRSVYSLGPIGLEYLNSFKKKTQEEVFSELGIQSKKNKILVTLHPETQSELGVSESISILLDALNRLDDCTIIFTMPNIDKGGDLIRNAIQSFVKSHSSSYAFESLGSENYLNVLQYADAIVGNSSSGIYEAPYLKIPTLNIGNRQEGRIRTSSIVDVPFESEKIYKSLVLILSDKKGFTNNLVYPYGKLENCTEIKDIILNFNFTIKKSFYGSVI